MTEQPLPSQAEVEAILEAEDAEFMAAAEWCGGIVTGPPREWPERIPPMPGTRTAGMVQYLLARMRDHLDSDEAAALQLTSLAIAIADDLEPEDDPFGRVLRARGEALRSHALVLSLLGHHEEALVYADRAASALESAPYGDFERARLALVQSCILCALNRHEEAFPVARDAAEAFGPRDAYDPLTTALLTAATAMHALGDPAAAREVRDNAEEIRTAVDPAGHSFGRHEERRLYERVGRVGE